MKLLRFFWDTHRRALPFVGELKWVSDKEHVMAWGDRQYALFRICLNNVPIQPQLNCCPSTSGLCSSCQQGGTTLGPSRLNSQSVLHLSIFHFILLVPSCKVQTGNCVRDMAFKIVQVLSVQMAADGNRLHLVHGSSIHPSARGPIGSSCAAPVKSLSLVFPFLILFWASNQHLFGQVRLVISHPVVKI